LYQDLPQTLGLDVITADAYIYGRYGVFHTHAERAEIARALAAEPRWLAIGGLPYWAEHFARRAEAILITSGPAVWAPPMSLSPTGLPKAVQPFFEKGYEEALQELEADPTKATYSYAFDGQVNGQMHGAYHLNMQEFLFKRFRRKIFMVDGEMRKQLKAVRALRPSPPA
jgi:hypothetical protein